MFLILISLEFNRTNNSIKECWSSSTNVFLSLGLPKEKYLSLDIECLKIDTFGPNLFHFGMIHWFSIAAIIMLSVGDLKDANYLRVLQVRNLGVIFMKSRSLPVVYFFYRKQCNY